ncbi:MAG: zinc ribbon domain-containing protein [Candidatus Bathyarchaeia archaeon]|jgi:ribosomal protein L40E
MARTSMLTQRSIVADDTLSMLTGQPRGALLSYTELTKMMHQYIRTKQLRLKACPSCNAPIPGYATFCDKCGKDVTPAPIQ